MRIPQSAIRTVGNQQLVTTGSNSFYCVRAIVPQILHPDHYLRTHLRRLWDYHKGASILVTIHLAFLRWVRVRIKAYGSERQWFSHTFTSTVVTSWICTTVCITDWGVLRPPSCCEESIYPNSQDPSLFLPSTKDLSVLRQRFLALTTLRQKALFPIGHFGHA